MPSTLKILCNTFLKQKATSAASQPPNDSYALGASSYAISAWTLETDHVKVTFSDHVFNGKNTWYVFWKHAVVYDNIGALVQPKKVVLPVPYYDQLSNQDVPYGSCNVTTMAMCLSYFGIGQKTSRSYPDELEDFCEEHGLDRHSPTDLAKVLNFYVVKDRFTQNATLNQVREWLVQGYPCVTHTYLTASGHIITIIGFDQTGFIVNDPYGEWCPDGYLRNDDSNRRRGKGLHYSNELFQEKILTGGEFWVHFISK